MVNFLKSAITNPLVAGITAFTFTTAVMTRLLLWQLALI